MADTSWEYIIPGYGVHNDTSKDAEVIVPGSGIVNEGVVAGGATVPDETLAPTMQLVGSGGMIGGVNV